MTKMTIEFHGVRGSIAAPGPDTANVGGNTSCVEVRVGDTCIVLDAGTGLRRISDRLMAEGNRSDTTILLSHVHWDHIQGIPFFVPLYTPGNRVRVLSGPNGFMPLADVLHTQMRPPCFPVALDNVATQLDIADLRPNEVFHVGDLEVTTARLNHPDPVYGYRLDSGEHSVVYATDTEHYSCVDPALRRLAEGADVLIYDAQYLPEEYSTRVGWGHSTYEAACDLATAASVDTLVLFHHDPARKDAAIDKLEHHAQRRFPSTLAARETHVIEVGSRANKHAA